jgi:hypothetical protein
VLNIVLTTRQWRERQALEIQRRDELSEARKRETIEKARQNIDDFYENYNMKRDKAIEETRYFAPFTCGSCK